MNVDFEYNEEKELLYKGERYLIRDNGAVFRFCKDSKCRRKLDEVWTFGVVQMDGYCNIGKERVHRLVAIAFHGFPPTSQHVVDHFDENRQNNRPENLRWLTKLENILNNPYTRRSVELICGSIDAFLLNPQLLYGHERKDKNFNWMRAVTKEEAANTMANKDKWLKQTNLNKGNAIEEWIFKQPSSEQSLSSTDRINTHKTKMEFFSDLSWSERHPDLVEKNRFELELTEGEPDIESEAHDNPYKMTSEMDGPLLTPSLTANATQDFLTPTEFLCCPTQEEKLSLESYFNRLKIDEAFSRNRYGTIFVSKRELSEDGKSLYVVGINPDSIKPYYFTRVQLIDQYYAHFSLGSFFKEVGAVKSMTLALGQEWTGGDVFDDFC